MDEKTKSQIDKMQLHADNIEKNYFDATSKSRRAWGNSAVAWIIFECSKMICMAIIGVIYKLDNIERYGIND